MGLLAKYNKNTSKYAPKKKEETVESVYGVPEGDAFYKNLLAEKRMKERGQESGERNNSLPYSNIQTQKPTLPQTKLTDNSYRKSLEQNYYKQLADKQSRNESMNAYAKELRDRMKTPNAYDKQIIQKIGRQAWATRMRSDYDTVVKRATKVYDENKEFEQSKANPNSALSKSNAGDKLNALERVGLAARSIGNTTEASAPILKEGFAQVGANADTDRDNPKMQELRLEQSELLKDMEYVSRYKYKTVTEGQKSPEYIALKKKLLDVNNQLQGTRAVTSVSLDGQGMQNMELAAQQREAATNGLSGGGKFIADGLISVADSASTLPLAIVNPTAPLLAMGAKSSAQNTYELSKQGESAVDALGRGLSKGGVEMLTEKIPLDNIIKIGKTGGKGIIKNLLQQSGIEATEEGTSYALNYLIDKAAKDPNATFTIAELAQSMAGGAFSGLIFAGGSSAVNKGAELITGGGRKTPAFEQTQEMPEPQEPTAQAAQTSVQQRVETRPYTQTAPQVQAVQSDVVPQDMQKVAPLDMQKIPQDTPFVQNTQEVEFGTDADFTKKPQNNEQWKNTAPVAPPQTMDQAQQRSQEIEYSVISSAERVGASEAEIEQVKTVAQTLQRKVEFIDDGEGSNGYYNPENDTIYIAKNAKNPAMNVFRHELTHSLEGTREYQDLENRVLNSDFIRKFKSEQNITLDRMAQLNQLEHRQRGRELGFEAAKREIVADYVGENLLTNEAEIMRLAVESPSLFKKIRYFLHDMYVKVRVTVHGSAAERELLEIGKLYKKAYDAAKTAGAGQNKNTATNDGEVKYSLMPYSDKEKENWSESKNIVLYESNEQFSKFIDDALSNKNTDKKMYFGAISADLAAEIKASTGIDVERYNCSIRGYEIRKIMLISHGDAQKEALRGQRAITKEDILNIPLIIQAPDKITLSDKLYQDKPIIQFEKTINGRTTVAAYVSKKHLDLTVQTMYSGIDKGSLATTPSGQTPFSHTSETSSGTASYDTNISQENKSVNTQPMPKPSENDTTIKQSIGEGFNEKYARLANKHGREAQEENIEAPLGTAVTRKTQDHLRKAINVAASKIADSMSIPKSAQKGVLREEIARLSELVQKDGKISAQNLDNAFEKAYNAGVVILDDYYNQYKDLRDELRKTPLQISQQDRTAIADFDDFRRQNSRKIRIVEDGGIPVDIKYIELMGEYPELFSADITHPADQLTRIAEVRGTIEKTQMSLNQYHGSDAAEYKKFARQEFDKFVADLIDAVEFSRKYEREAAEKRTKAVMPEVDIETYKQAYAARKQIEREVDKVRAKYLLTEADNNSIDRLLKGELEPSDIKPPANKNGIIAVYKAKRPLYEIDKILKNHTRQHKQAQLDEELQLIENADDWKDKKIGILDEWETPERNIRDIIKDKYEAAKVNAAIFEPIHASEAESTRYKNKLRGRIKALNIGSKEKYYLDYKDPNSEFLIHKKVSESTLVQMLGEGIIKEANIENSGADVQKITNAVSEFRAIYNEIIEKINTVLIKNGYAPVEYRKDYFPHFQKNMPDSILSKIGEALGIDIEVDVLPTNIAGVTYQFKPGKQWVANFLARKGNDTVYDAIEGFDRYISGASNVIYHTDNIQRLRAFENAVRYKFSDKGIQAEIDTIMTDKNIDEADRTAKLDALYGRDVTKMSTFVMWLRNYTDVFAGKKHLVDRTPEYLLGRTFLRAVSKATGRVYSNMVAVNPGSWLTNFIPLTQAVGEIKPMVLLQAAKETLMNTKNKDGFIDTSDFLTNRRGSQLLAMGTLDNISATLTKPMEIIDRFTAQTIVRGKFKQNLANNMSPVEAMKDANRFAASVMADRSKGAMPTAFEAKNPFVKVLTTFQLEQKNQLSYIFKDAPRELKEKSIAALIVAMGEKAIGALLYNWLYEKLVGRKPALDPLGMGIDAIQDFMNEELAASEALKKTVMGMVEEIPFIGGLAGGGRLPVSAAIPELEQLYKAVGADVSWAKKKEIIGKEIGGKLGTYFLAPVGGGQAKKVIEGADAMIKGGSYTVNNEGEKQLQFLVNQNPLTALQMTLFGKWATKEAQEYVDGGFKKFSAKNTATIDAASEQGIDKVEAAKLIKELNKFEAERDADGEITTSTTELKRQYIFEQDLTEQQKNWLDKEIIEREEKKDFSVDEAVSRGISKETATKLFDELSGVESTYDLDGNTMKSAADLKREIVDKKTLAPAQKKWLNSEIAAGNFEVDYSSDASLGISKYGANIQARSKIAEAGGIDAETFLAAYEAQRGIESDKSKIGTTIPLTAARKRKKAVDEATPELSRLERNKLYAALGISEKVW